MRPQEFIEAIIAYLNAMPLADVYQDEAWQKKIDAMQGGGITAAAGAEEAAADQHLIHRDKTAEEALAWLVQKEAAELELLRGQSSMWFYLEVRRLAVRAAAVRWREAWFPSADRAGLGTVIEMVRFRQVPGSMAEALSCLVLSLPAGVLPVRHLHQRDAGAVQQLQRNRRRGRGQRVHGTGEAVAPQLVT